VGRRRVSTWSGKRKGKEIPKKKSAGKKEIYGKKRRIKRPERMGILYVNFNSRQKKKGGGQEVFNGKGELKRNNLEFKKESMGPEGEGKFCGREQENENLLSIATGREGIW